MLPHVADRALREDPERLAMACIPILRYADAYYAHKRANKSELKAWKGDPVMDMVERNAFEMAKEEISGAKS